MPIKTKIVATLGPASWDLPAVTSLASAGVDVFRLNFSHGTIEQHARSLANVRTAAQTLKRPLAVLADLCGPKIRVGPIAGGAITLADGAELIIQREPLEGTAARISTTLPELIDEVKTGERLSFNDGRIQLEILRTKAPREIVCRVLCGGELKSAKGVNLPDTDLSLPALTEKDRHDADWIAQQDIDYVALSFVQRARDIEHLRGILTTGGSSARIIAKIEKPQALRNIDAIIEAADAVLVARGDLGVEMDLPEVPVAQKQLAGLCQRAGKCCIIATQMLESMIDSATPTRAEVSDVANAVFDGADAVMLSGETAVGKYSVQAVLMMDAVCQRAERYLDNGHGDCLQHSQLQLSGTDNAVIKAVHHIIHTDDIKAVAVFTVTGATARMLAKMRLEVPILALTPSQRVLQQACLFYGVQAELAETPRHTREVLSQAAQRIRGLKWAKKGEKIVVVSGRPLGKPGCINTIVVHTI
jgi:pyruvate kinase